VPALVGFRGAGWSDSSRFLMTGDRLTTDHTVRRLNESGQAFAQGLLAETSYQFPVQCDRNGAGPPSLTTDTTASLFSDIPSAAL